jgi:hypothetical protein
MSDAIFLAKKPTGYLNIGDRKEIDKAVWCKPRGLAADFALHSRQAVSRVVDLFSVESAQHNRRKRMSRSNLARTVRRYLWTTVTWAFILIATSGRTPSEAQTRKIVGLGATTCQHFNADVAANPASGRDYLAWAQGYMSGILLSRPAGVDDGLDLSPPTFGLLNQLKFLEDYCTGNASMDFGDAVEALYKRLRREGKT